MCLLGSGASSLLLEQRVHPQSDRGELSSHPATGVRHPLQSLQGALEPVSTTQEHSLTLSVPSDFTFTLLYCWINING